MLRYRLEPAVSAVNLGFLVLYAVSEKHNPTLVRFFCACAATS
jgi:hypothetical protein